MLSIFSFHTFLRHDSLEEEPDEEADVRVEAPHGREDRSEAFFSFGSQNMLIFEGWHSTSTVSGISATSPSMWTVPGSLRMVALGVRDCLDYDVAVDSSREKFHSHHDAGKGSPECITVMSSTPSWIEAVGAMNALLPYCDALHTATRRLSPGMWLPEWRSRIPPTCT